MAAPPGWGATSSKPTAKDLVPDPRGTEAYSERYTFFARLEGGGEAYVDVTISNLGWGDRHGATTGRIRLPGEKTYRFKKTLDDGDWSYRRDRFEITVGPTTVSGDPKNGFVVKHRGKKSFELSFTSKTSMWRPGSGRIFHDGKIYGTTLAVPWGDVSGTVSTGSGAREVSGVGMFDHGRSTIAPFDLAEKFTRMRHYENGLFIAWREVELTDDVGDGSVTWVIVGMNDRIVFHDSNARIEWSGHAEHGESGHRVPTRVRITGKQGGTSLELEISGRRTRSTDLLAEYGTAARAVAGAVSNPWQFELRGTYDLKLTGSTNARRTGRTSVELDML
jgi:hypothetical protein